LFRTVTGYRRCTGTVPHALFQAGEDTAGYFRLMKGIADRKGLPLALYSDRNTIFRSARSENDETPVGVKLEPTQFGRAMRELGVTQVFARAPRPKAESNGPMGPFQDRLVTELRLAGATTMAEANTLLESFLPRFNERFVSGRSARLCIPPGKPRTKPGRHPVY